jgi:hypothetical protein
LWIKINKWLKDITEQGNNALKHCKCDLKVGSKKYWTKKLEKVTQEFITKKNFSV